MLVLFCIVLLLHGLATRPVTLVEGVRQAVRQTGRAALPRLTACTYKGSGGGVPGTT